MVKVTTVHMQCDFCLRKVSEHAAYMHFGYMSDGAGTFHDFCDAESCVQEAREIADKHAGIRVWWPGGRSGRGKYTSEKRAELRGESQ